VVGNNEEVNYAGSSGNIYYYIPVVEYVVGDNHFKVVGSNGSWPPTKIGTRLMVMYNPANPSEAFVEKGYYFAATGLMLLGIAFMSLGSVFAYEFCF
jgi:hypothetical protein